MQEPMFGFPDHRFVSADLTTRIFQRCRLVGLSTFVALIAAGTFTATFGADAFHIAIGQIAFIVFTIELQSCFGLDMPFVIQRAEKLTG